MAKILILTIALLSSICCAQEETSKSISSSFHSSSPDQGLCPFAVFSDRNGPIAAFGVYKNKNDKSKFGYLILFPTPEQRKEACEVSKSVKSDSSSETSTDAVAELKWDDNKIKVAWKLTTDDSTGRIDNNDFKINGKTFAPDSRLLLAKRVGDKLEFTAVKATMPNTVPDATTSQDWTKEIQAAIKELRSSSPDVAKFLKKS